MKTLLFGLATIVSVAIVGCSESSVDVAHDATLQGKHNAELAAFDMFIKIPPIEGESEKLEQAMEIYSGNGSMAIGLLLPAIQKVRGALVELEQEADRDGYINAKPAAKHIREATLTCRKAGKEQQDAEPYTGKEICQASDPEEVPGREGWIDILAHGTDNAGNTELMLHHFFNGARNIMDDAGVSDPDIDAAMAELLALIADISEVRP